MVFITTILFFEILWIGCAIKIMPFESVCRRKQILEARRYLGSAHLAEKPVHFIVETQLLLRP